MLGFGSYVRTVAADQGLPEDFSTLQALGQSMVEKDPASFVAGVFEYAGHTSLDSIILDGMRHVEVLNALQSFVAPSIVRLVLVKVDRGVLAARHEEVGQDISEVLAGPAEQQVQSALAKLADLVVDGNAPVDIAVKNIIKLTTET